MKNIQSFGQFESGLWRGASVVKGGRILSSVLGGGEEEGEKKK